MNVVSDIMCMKVSVIMLCCGHVFMKCEDYIVYWCALCHSFSVLVWSSYKCYQQHVGNIEEEHHH